MIIDAQFIISVAKLAVDNAKSVDVLVIRDNKQN